jgi:tetraacyldisaccharide-1-P 4'-kinase
MWLDESEESLWRAAATELRWRRAASAFGAAVGLMSGPARPTSLRKTVKPFGAVVVTERNFRDHHCYGPRDMRYLYRNAPLWITTERDAIKIDPDRIGRASVRVLSIELEAAQEGPLLDWLEASLR